MKPAVTVLLIVLTAFCQAECPIECFCDRVTTCTGDNLLTRFPQTYTGPESSGYISPLLTTVPIRIELHDFAVKHLSRQDFLDIISNLSEVSISRNSLETFDNDTFSLEFTTSLSTSAVLSASSSSSAAVVSGDVAGDSPKSTSARRGSAHTSDESQRALSFSSAREPTPGLREHGATKSAETGTFLQLKILDLSQNKLKYFVGGGKLRKLKILDLSSNVLQQVYELSAMQNLESVNLRDNRISYLEANIFQNLRNLQYVNLDANVLGFVHPSTFSNLPALAHLILSSNPISNLLPGFYWNSRVQFVDVSNVGLTSIPPSITKTVRDFRCANNNLTIIRQTDFESYPNVGLLVLDENAIETVEDDAFGRLDFLSRLWINGNRLKRIPQNLPPSLRSLQLESNLITNLTVTDFKNLKRLEELNLHSNRIASLPPSVFSELTSLKSLDLRSNLIDVIYRDSFANLSKLETLDISQNPIKVIVTGAFGSLRRVTQLHLSRLMETIELDVSTFRPLQNLQILELDNSPHLALKLFQDGGFSYFPYLSELNVQYCELDDVNLVSNALVELNLHTIKMNANLWDCEDLHGSAFYELISRRVVADGPTCSRPPKFRGMTLASLNFSTPKESLNVINSEEKNPNFALPFVTPLTRTSDSLTENFSETSSIAGIFGTKREHDSTSPASQDAQNANSPEKATHVVAQQQEDRKTGQGITELVDAVPAPRLPESSQPPGVSMTNPKLSSASPAKATSAANPASPLSNSTALRSLQSSLAQASGHNHDSSSTAVMSDRTKQQPLSSPVLSKVATDGTGFVDILENEGDAVPTQSYFDYPSSRTRTEHNEETSGDGDARDSSNVSGNNTSESRSSSGDTGNKGTNSGINSPPISTSKTGSKSTTRQRSRRPSSSPAGARTSEETKTNDDNAIIDERRLQRTGREEEQEGSAAVQRSIDGFPPAYPDNDRVANPAPSGSDNAASSPSYSYLKLNDNSKVQRRSDLPYNNNNSSAHSQNMTVIVKTLVISALACLGSILSLFFLSFAIYRCSLKRNRGGFSCARPCSQEEGEDSQQRGAGMVYTRFGARKSIRESFSSNGTSNRRSSASITGRYHHHRESDSDQVELSGITNSLYFENEDIYHIT